MRSCPSSACSARIPRGVSPTPYFCAAVLALAAFAPLAAHAAPAAYSPGEVLVAFSDKSAPVGVRRALTGGAARAPVAPGIDRVTLAPGETVEQALNRLRATPGIKYVQPNYLTYLQLAAPNDPDFKLQWGLENTGQAAPAGRTGLGTPGADVSALKAWDVTQGSRKVIVAIIDSGLDMTHPDLKQNLWRNPKEIAGNGVDDDHNGYIDDVNGWDFVDDDNDPTDMNSHGTYVAGVLAAQGDNGVAVAGAAWEVSVMVLRAFDANGVGKTDRVVKAMDYAVKMGAKIINASFGTLGTANPPSNQSEYDAVAAAGDQGLLVVASACNDGMDNDNQQDVCVPASYDLPNLLSVAATTRADELWSLSNYGRASVDLAAPGQDIATVGPSFIQVWPLSGSTVITSGYVATGIDLRGQSHCRAVVDYSGTQFQVTSRLIFEARLAGDAAWIKLGDPAPLDVGGVEAAYGDLNRFDGRPDVELRVSSQGLGGGPIGGLRVECYGADDPRTYHYGSGTSLAVPFVSGAAALLLANDDTMDVAALKAAILGGVDPLTSLTGFVATGGRLNLAGALAQAGASAPTTQGNGDGGGGGGGGGAVVAEVLLLGLIWRRRLQILRF